LTTLNRERGKEELIAAHNSTVSLTSSISMLPTITAESIRSTEMNEAMAAAVTAADELAKNVGGLYFNNIDIDFQAQKELVPMMISSQHQDDPSLMEEVSGEDEDDSQDAKTRICKSRARNREHARRTRIRKKAQLEKLQDKMKGLQEERQVLKQSLEEYSIASILTSLGRSGSRDNTFQTLLQEASNAEESQNIIPPGKRNRFVSVDITEKQPPQPLKIKIGGKTAFIGGGRNHINWKTGVYSDEHGVQKQLSCKQLETLRYVPSCFKLKLESWLWILS
jgi:hypothetical protein